MPAPNLKLISHKLCPYVQRARIVLEEKAIPHEIEFIDLANKPRWFLDLSPLGKVPVLIVDDKPLFESAVIAEYLDEVTPGSLHPANSFAKAGNRAWIEFASNMLAVIASFYNAHDPLAFQNSVDLLQDRFRSVEKALGDGPWFNGPLFSLVDAAYGPVFRYFDVIDQYADFDFFTDTPKVVAWRRALSQRPSIRKAVVTDYRERLYRFLVARQSVLSVILSVRRVA